MVETSQTHVVAFDEQGPIEVEMVGAQPAGETLIESLRDSAPVDAEIISETQLTTDTASVPTPIGATEEEAPEKCIVCGGDEPCSHDFDKEGAKLDEIFAKMGSEQPDHTVRKHHKYGMSKLGYLSACPGFTSTDGSSEAAEQGTRLHEIMDLLIERYKASKRPLMTLLSEWCAENPIDDDERFLLVYCIRELDKWAGKANEIVNEIRVQILNPDNSELNHGHLDLLFIFGDWQSALLIDYKFGWIPVPPAADNFQGRGYALAVLQKYPRLPKIAVQFIQPKLGLVSSAVYTRPQINEMYQSIRQVIDRAELVQRNPNDTQDLLSPSDYCAYCFHAKEGTCPAKVKQLRSAVVALHPNQSAGIMDLEKIQTPQQAAKLRHAIELLESGEFLEQAKAKCREMATQNGGEISYETPSGEVIRYAIEDRRHDRSLGDTLEVATTLRDQNIMPFEQILACADLSIGKLEAAGTEAIYEAQKAEMDRQVRAKEAQVNALVAAGKMTKTEAKKQVAAVKAEFKATKKLATESFQKILENQGLLSRPDGTIKALKRKKNETKAQIPAKTV